MPSLKRKSGPVRTDKRPGEQKIASPKKTLLRKKIVLGKNGDLLEEKYKLIFQSARDAILYINHKGEIIDANQSCESLSGYALDKIIGSCVWKLPFLRFGSGQIPTLQAYIKKGTADPFELELIHKSGEKKTVEANASLIRKKGFIRCAQVIVRDITHRKEAENILKDSENFHRTIIENTGTATIIVEDDMSISYANAQFSNLSGYTTEQLTTGMRWADFFVDEDAKKMREYHEKRRVNPYSVPRNYESKFINRDGDIKSVFLTVAMIPGTKKSVASLLDMTGRKQVESELKKSKKLFDDLVEGSPAALFVVDLNHQIVYWNKAMEKMTGLKADQMIGTSDHWKPFYSKPTKMITDMLIDGEKWKDILEQEQYQQMDIEEHHGKNGIVCSRYFNDFGGKKKWLRFKIKPLYDIDKKLVGAIETVDDITDRREMRTMLENRMREFQVLYQVNFHIRMLKPINDVLKLIVKDITQACDEVGPARARIEFNGKKYTNLKRKESFAYSIKEPIKVMGEKRGFLEIGYADDVFNDETSKLKHERKVLQIVAETLSRHIQHREVVERYQKLVTRSVVGIFILKDGVFQYVNPKFARIFKSKELDIVGQSYKSVIPNYPCYGKPIKGQAFANAHCEFRVVRKDGVEIDVEVFNQTIDYQGKKAILGTLQDVSKLKEAQRRQQHFNQELKAKIAEKTTDLQRANRRLQSLNEIKDEFIAVTSHELRSPLTAARGYLSFLMDDEMSMPAEARDYLVRVYDNVEVLNNLVNNILDVSRIEMDRLELYKTPTDIVTMVKQVINNLNFQAAEKKIEVEFKNLLDEDELILEVDNVRLRQVIRNILDNAIKYSYDSKPIQVEVSIRGIGVQIAIVDQGQGIRKSEIFDIFDKFKQAKNSQAQYKGAGLGLFIARKIVELHNGMIWAESKVGKGTTFRIQLPLE